MAKRFLFLLVLALGVGFLAKRGAPHADAGLMNDPRYDNLSIAYLAEQNRFYRDSLLANDQDLALCERTLSDVRAWNGLSPKLELFQRRVATWRGRLRAALWRPLSVQDLKAGYAMENDGFRALLTAGYPEIIATRWDLALYQQGVQTRAGGSVAAWQLESCQEPLGAWGVRLSQAALPEEILAWRQKN